MYYLEFNDRTKLLNKKLTENNTTVNETNLLQIFYHPFLIFQRIPHRDKKPHLIFFINLDQFSYSNFDGMHLVYLVSCREKQTFKTALYTTINTW